jgi:transcriptional regulator with XRE-family HTH domain
MPESFGARLRQRREERQIALTSIADETKIKLALLEGLERDDVSHWPSGIFRKAYLRAYAHMIGLDPDGALREFLELYPEPGDVFEQTAVALAQDGDGSRRIGPPTRLRNMVDSAIGSLAKLRRPAGVEDTRVPQQGTRLGVRRPIETPSEALQAARVAVAPIDIDDIDDCDQLSPEPDPAAIAQPSQAVATVPVSVPALLKPADPGDATVAVGAPPEPLAFNPPVRVSTPAPQAETVEFDAVDPPVLAPAPVVSAPVQDPPAPNRDLDAIAGLCTALARVVERDEIQQLLQEAAHELNAIGIIIWTWDTIAEELRPALVHGYSSRVLAQLPPVRRDADNVTAAAFRSGRTCEMKGGSDASGALVVPLLTAGGCPGVLALELQPGAAHTRSNRAVATILAAVLGPLVMRLKASDVRPQPQTQPQPQPERVVPVTAPLRSPLRPMRVRR